MRRALARLFSITDTDLEDRTSVRDDLVRIIILSRVRDSLRL